MTVKATAHSEPRGSLCSTSCQPSAAESCSPTATRVHMTLPYARMAWWYRRQVMLMAALIVGTIDCECAADSDTCLPVPSAGLQSHAAGINWFPLRKLFASSWTARWLSIVDDAINDQAGVRIGVAQRTTGQSSHLWPQWAAVQTSFNQMSRLSNDSCNEPPFSIICREFSVNCHIYRH